MFAAYLNLGTSVEDVFAQISAFFSKWVKDITVDDFKKFLLPHCTLAIKNINIALEFPRTVLIPVDEATINAIADQRDENGNFRYPQLRNSGFGTNNTTPHTGDELQNGSLDDQRQHEMDHER